MEPGEQAAELSLSSCFPRHNTYPVLLTPWTPSATNVSWSIVSSFSVFSLLSCGLSGAATPA